MPSATLQEYLEAIYKMSQNGDVRPTAIAETLGVSGPTVTATMRRLEGAGLITRPSGGVALTEAGLREAIEVVRRHRIAERFLVDVLQIPWDSVHEEACLLEHAMSPRVLGALEAYLDNPVVCPHGHPIPSVDGSLPDPKGESLAGVAVGGEGLVVRVGEDDDAILSYLGTIGLVPGARIRVLEIAPFDGPLLLTVAGIEHAVSRQVAGVVFVELSDAVSSV
jgi:DtxR family Mn-dependent transcriptional regulator